MELIGEGGKGGIVQVKRRAEAVLVHVPFLENMSTAFEAAANKMSDSLKALAKLSGELATYEQDSFAEATT